MVLRAGQAIPSQGKLVQRGEGVALVLSGCALSVWKKGGKQWKAWNPRSVTASLQLSGGAGGRLHVVSCYAPTRAASRKDKEAFWIPSSLQYQQQRIMSSSLISMTQVGSREINNEELWDGARVHMGLVLTMM